MDRAWSGMLVGRRTKFAVLIFWLIVVALTGPLAKNLTNAEHNDSTAWLPGSAESTQLLKELGPFQSPNTFPAVVVYVRPTGLTATDKSAIASDAQHFATVGPIDGRITGPVYSSDGKAAEITVPFNLGNNGWNKAAKIVDSMRTTAKQAAPGLETHVTGQAGYAADSSNAFKGIDGTLLLAAGAVVIVILLLTYRSPFLWLLPVISAIVALFTAEGVIYLLAKHAGLTVNAQSAGILTVLVFGAGTDCALLLVARYREELRRHTDRHEAMAIALHRAGPAVFASAGTVVLGMLCLLVAETNSTRGLGSVAAIGIVIALASMSTLLPALLVICGRWVFWPAKPTVGSAEPTATGVWARTGTRIARHPRRVWVTTALVLGVFAIGVIDLNANGLSNAGSYRGHPDSVIGEQQLSLHFPAGEGSPVQVIAPAAEAASAHSALAGSSGVTGVTSPVVRDNEAYIQGTLTAAPDSQTAYDAVDRIRASVHAAAPGAKVGGDSAVNLDIARAARHDREIIIPLILVVVLIVLALLLRCLLAPVILIATVVLSFSAAIGLSGVFFKHVFHYEGADTAFPLFVFVFLVALGIDYNIFLMTRVREEAHKHGTRIGALTGLAATGGVITSAGLVLAGTFAALGTLPVTAFSEIGFAVALGVLLDTLVVRSVLVTALNLDIGRYIWWPSKLMQHYDVDEPAGLDPESVEAG
ncbi:MAG TPA: MMPL family transporter [Mycobacteriales bacterium]|nr:MMPL family transporter [Mycobacteriales bacterium]